MAKSKGYTFVQLSKDEKHEIMKMRLTHSPSEIAEYIGCSRAAVYTLYKINGVTNYRIALRKWTWPDELDLIEYYKQGKSVSEIAEHLDRSPKSVIARANKLRKEFKLPYHPNCKHHANTKEMPKV